MSAMNANPNSREPGRQFLAARAYRRLRFSAAAAAFLAAAMMSGAAVWFAGSAAEQAIHGPGQAASSSSPSVLSARSGTLVLISMQRSAGQFAADSSCNSTGITSLTVTPGDSQVSLSWCEPVDNNPQAPLAYYNIYIGSSSSVSTSGTPAAAVYDASTTSATVTGLTNGTTYYFVVQARAKSGHPISTSAAESATPMAPPSVPDAPTGLTASAGDSEVSLTWTAPASDNGSPVASYNVYAGTSAGGENYDTPAATVSGTSATVTGLTDGTTYYFVVTAVSDAGEGPASDESSAMPAVPPPPSQGATGQPPANVPAASPPGPSSSAVLVIVVLLGAAVVVAALVLVARRRRMDAIPASDAEPNVRVEPIVGPPQRVAVHPIGSLPTVTVRFEPDPGVSSATIAEVRQ